MADRDDAYWLYDLKVEVLASDKPMVCNHQVGDYFLVEGEVEVDYSSKQSAKYNQRSSLPVESMMWKNSF